MHMQKHIFDLCENELHSSASGDNCQQISSAEMILISFDFHMILFSQCHDVSLEDKDADDSMSVASMGEKPIRLFALHEIEVNALMVTQ